MNHNAFDVPSIELQPIPPLTRATMTEPADSVGDRRSLKVIFLIFAFKPTQLFIRSLVWPAVSCVAELVERHTTWV